MNRTPCLTLIFLLVGIYAQAQTSSIKGIVTNVKKIPVEYANVVLYDSSDSTKIVKATTTDVTGRFELSRIPHGSYRLQASCVGYVVASVRIKNLQEHIKDLQIVMAEQTVALGETTVTAQRVVMEFDRQIIYPGKQEKETSIDGVDLIDKLCLDGIMVGKVEGTISSVLGGGVNLRINGGPASLNDLKQIDPKMVRRVEYHDMPSMRYGKVDAVIDLYVKQREFGGSGRFDVSHSAKSPIGNGLANLKLYHKKSEFSFWGNGNYGRYSGDHNKQTVTYNFEDGSTLTRHEDFYSIGHSHEDSYNGGVGYSYLNPDDVLFTAKFSGSGSPREYANRGDVRMDGELDTKTHEVRDRLKKTSRLGLYFQKNLKKKQFVAFEVSGSYLHTNSHYIYNEQQEDVILADILSDVSGDTYSLVAEGVYEKRFKTNKLSIGLNHRLSYADNDYTGTTIYKTKFNTSNTYGYVEWMGGVKKLNYSLAARGTYNQIVQRGEKTRTQYPWITWRLGYRFNNKVQLRYLGETYVTIPSLNTLNNVDQAIDVYQIRRGNPNLKNTTAYTNTLILNHKCTNNFSYVLNVNDVYTIHPPFSTTFQENGKFVTQEQNGRNYHQLHLFGNVGWALCDNRLRLNGRIGYKFVKKNRLSFSNSHKTCYGNAGFEWNFLKKSAVFCEVHKTSNILLDETISFGNWYTVCGIGYIGKKWFLTASMKCLLGNDFIDKEKGLVPYIQRSYYRYSPKMRTQVTLRIARNFKFGRQRKNVNQRIENSGGESAVFE